MAEKLIPGLPEETRITILQQTDVGDVNADEGPVPTPSEGEGPVVLEEVIERATAKQEVQKEIDSPYPILDL